MATEIKVARPGVVLRKRVARTPKHCAACGCLISPGVSYWDRKVSGKSITGALNKLTREQAEDFVKEINSRVEKQASLF